MIKTSILRPAPVEEFLKAEFVNSYDFAEESLDLGIDTLGDVLEVVRRELQEGLELESGHLLQYEPVVVRLEEGEPRLAAHGLPPAAPGQRVDQVLLLPREDVVPEFVEPVREVAAAVAVVVASLNCSSQCIPSKSLP